MKCVESDWECVMHERVCMWWSMKDMYVVGMYGMCKGVWESICSIIRDL